MEDRLRASEEMRRAAMLGELAGSIAHEVNQPLTAIVTHANASLRWLARQPPEIDEARQAIASVVREGIRAGDIIARVRAMTRNSAVRSGNDST
jgi:C4-dicarboxylate-specific signal transduction histidine kinase